MQSQDDGILSKHIGSRESPVNALWSLRNRTTEKMVSKGSPPHHTLACACRAPAFMKTATGIRLGAILGLGLVTAGSHSALADTDAIRDGMISHLSPCLTTLDDAHSLSEGTSSASRCAKDRALTELLGTAAQLADEVGRARFGEQFRIVNRLSYSSTAGGIAGDVDVVFPVAFASAAATGAAAPGRALFLQHGLTTWEDGHDFRRNDLRTGMVHRFAVSEAPGADVVGVSAWFQQNVERGHQRVGANLDYAGAWGTSSLTWFLPVTDWRPGRAGFEERPIEGMELGVDLKLTTTLELNTAVGRWEDDTAGDRWETTGRIGLDWRPHTYLTFAGSFGGGATVANDNVAFMVTYARPFGGGAKQERPRWRGLGRLAGGAEPGAGALWRPLDHVGRIHTIDRETPDKPGTVEGARVRFLQESAASGGEFELEVTLTGPVSEETTVTVRLFPGSGDNPAVPGVDYTDEPIAVTIPRGAARGTATVRLLHNSDLDTPRSLSARVLHTA